LPHPELFTLAHRDAGVRRSAERYTTDTIRFAAELGARVVVAHAGNVDMPNLTAKLMALHAEGKASTPAYDKVKMQLLAARDGKAARQLEFLYAGVEALLPELERCNVALAFENLPSWEAIPTEAEAEKLLRHFNSPRLRHWHDLGHGQVREDLGFGNHRRWVERLRPWIAGLHIHDLIAPDADHLMPPEGHLPFASFREVAQDDLLRVLEPSPGTPREAILRGLEFLRRAWAAPPEAVGG
jgi:sugar phosphate isomerase/epimerase